MEISLTLYYIAFFVAAIIVSLVFTSNPFAMAQFVEDG